MYADLLSVKTADGTTAKINAYVRMFSDRLRREETERWKESSKELIVVNLTAKTIEMVSFFGSFDQNSCLCVCKTNTIL